MSAGTSQSCRPRAFRLQYPPSCLSDMGNFRCSLLVARTPWRVTTGSYRLPPAFGRTADPTIGRKLESKVEP
ncbi:hypothetical protein FIBSPDRAFT_876251, partial [Athelia psychrophila]